MYKLCNTEKSALQQRRFEDVFLELALEQPYDDITISELCRRAGLSRKIFYRLFEKKADVFYALLDQTLLDFETYQPDPSVGEGGMRRFFAFWKEQKPLLDVLEFNQSNSLLTERVIYHIFHVDTDILQCLHSEIPDYSREALLFYVSGLFSLVLDWHARGYDRSIGQMSETLAYLLTTSPEKHILTWDPNWNDK